MLGANITVITTDKCKLGHKKIGMEVIFYVSQHGKQNL